MVWEGGAARCPPYPIEGRSLLRDPRCRRGCIRARFPVPLPAAPTPHREAEAGSPSKIALSAPSESAILLTNCCPLRGMITAVLQYHSHRTLPDLRRKSIGCLLRHGSTFSSCGASGKPGAFSLLKLWSLRTWRASCRRRPSGRHGRDVPRRGTARSGLREDDRTAKALASLRSSWAWTGATTRPGVSVARTVTATS